MTEVISPKAAAVAAMMIVTLTAIPAHAVVHGDCNESGGIEINEVQRCANIFAETQAIDTCRPCDLDGSGAVEINEVQGTANCFLDTASVGCRMLPTVADTPVPTPTSTSGPTDTATAEPTATMPPPADTATETATNIAPPTFTATPMPPTPTETPTPGMAVCGNGEVEDGETCDDGNTLDGDECPSDCVIVGCVPSGTTTAVDVNFQSTVSLLSITVFLEYPDGMVQIPGTGTDASVGMRVINRPGGFLATFVDRDYGLRGTLSGSRAFPSTRIFTVNFDDCQDASGATPADFTCTVLEAADLGFQAVQGATCSVSLP